MIGMALRQMRAAILGTAALTGLIVVVLAVHGGIARGVSTRLTQACASTDTATCHQLQNQLWGMYKTITPYLGYLTITTVLVAAFWGAPLISREIETGTAALAWCQSVTRRRWFTSRLIVSVSAVATLGLLLGFTVTWWLASFTAAPQVGERALSTISLHGPLLPAMWIAGLLVGVLIGALIRRTLPAMTVTAVVTLLGAMAFNLTGSLSTADPTGELQVLTNQSLQAIPVLAVAAIATLIASRRIRTVRI
jgi:ABC-type transport system involved in multi-copper enzyme maturation permease subunit